MNRNFYYIFVSIAFFFFLIIDSMKFKIASDYIVIILLMVLYPFIFNIFKKINNKMQICVGGGEEINTYLSFFFNAFFSVFSLMYFAIILLHSIHKHNLRAILIPLSTVLLSIIFLFTIIKLLKKEEWFTDKFLNFAKDCSDLYKTDEKCCYNYAPVFVCGFILFSFIIYYFEKNLQNLYFLNDDNFHQFLPVIIQSMRGFFEQGLFPEINQHQMLGSPTSSLSVYSLTYPITYLSYAVARYIIHNEFWTIDIFSIIHLIFAYILSFMAAKSLKIRPVWCLLFTLCYCFSGCSLIIMRSWYYMAPIVAFAPSIIIALEYIRKKTVDFKYILSFGILLGILFHSGNVQMVSYIYIFYTLSLLILYITKEFTLKKTFCAFFPLILGLIVSIPLTLITFETTQNIKRLYIQGLNLNLDTFKYFFFPFGKGIKSLCFSSGILFSIGLFQIIMLFVCLTIKNIDLKKYISKNLYLILGILALILCFGEGGIIWKLLHSLPIFLQFKHPCKMVLFVNLFVLISACKFLSCKIKNNILKILLFTLALAMMLLMNKHDTTFFYYENNNYNYPNSMEKNIKDINKYRIYSFAPMRSPAKYYSLTMQNNFASIYKLYSIQMFKSNLDDILTENKKWNNFLGRYIHWWFRDFRLSKKKEELLCEYGVKYMILPDINTYRWISTKRMKDMEKANIKYLEKHYKEILNDNKLKIKVYELPNPRPLCFIKDTYNALPVELNSQGGVIETKGLKAHTKIILNMIYRPNYAMYIGKKKYPVSKDNLDRIEIDLPVETDKITVKYHSPWEVSTLIAFVLLIFFVIGMIFFRRYYNE